MMITIYGLPATIKYQDLKILISRECNISDFILDYLVSDGDGTKKVRVGLADDAEGNHLMKYLDGYRLSGHVLKLVPVGKSATANNQPQTYPPRGNFSHSDYPNQTAKTVEPKLSWSGNQWPTNPVQNTYNYQQPQALNTQYVQSQSTQPAKQFDTREISTANRAQSQTNVSQNYSYPSKTNLISLGPHRNVTSLTTNVPDASNRIQANRYPGYDGPEKPVLIMKENFRGPQSNQFISTQTVNYPNQSWSGQQVQKPYEKHSQTFDKKYNERKYPQNQTATDVTKDSFKYDRSGYQKYPDERRNSPNRQNDRLSVRNIERQSDRHVARPSDRDYDRSSDRHIRPSDRNIDRSSERHVDRSGRNIDRPEGNISISSNRNADRPYGRDIDRPADRNINKQTGISRISPTRQRQTPVSRIDDRFSPSRNRQQSPRRRLSPLTRKEEYASRRPSPPAITPVDRLASRQSPTRQAGYSPRRTDKSREFNENRVKDVRPAYEPQASKAAMYSGGYRPNVPVDVQYPRKDWKDREKQFSPKNALEDRRDIVRMQNFDIPRASEQQRMEEEKKRSQSRNSRSPRREKSPGRHRRQSPSSRSPRRAWALEKRRSPEGREPPPPPAWPGQDGGEQEYQQRSKLTDRDVVMKVPVWECKKTDNYSKTDRRNFEEQRNRKELSKWKPVPPVTSEENTRFLDDDRYRKGGKYGRKEPERRRTLSRDDGERKSYSERHEKDLSRSERDGARYKPDFSREEYAGRIEEKKKEILHKQEQLQKEIDEVYKRAVDFTKKAEMYKKGEMNKDFHFKEERHREDREYEERQHYSFDENRRGRNLDRPNEHKSSNFGKSRDPEDFERKFGVNAAIKIKRLKATDEISEKILHQFAVNIPPDFRKRVSEELKLSVAKILLEMFGEKDVSFIEMLVKFNARHTQKDEERIFEDVMSCLPSHFKTIKRSAQDNSGIPAKVSRRSADLTLDTDVCMNKPTNWNYGQLGSIIPGNVMVDPTLTQMAASGLLLNTPIMVPISTQYPVITAYPDTSNIKEEDESDGHTLYLCKDNFQTISEYEIDQLKSFLIKQLVEVTETSQGWAPDFTLSNQRNTHRHEVFTRDQRSKDWLLNLDFSDFTVFKVLVYTSEELWYERAAIWLPGHSRHRKFDPLTKLKLQNRKLEGVNIGKWKFIKRIITANGTRIYVDMPPSSARALEKHKMLLSYELQKVNVFFKAVAIDKNAFDAGLNEPSIEIPLTPASCPMPSLGQDPRIIKFALKGNKPFNLGMARKIKDIILFKLFKYHELEGRSRTDFEKYGFCQPGYFGILPENEESRKWLVSLDIPRINRQPVVIVGADDIKGKFFRMNIVMPNYYNLKPALAFERLRQSNQGVKGINFNMWKNLNVIISRREGKVGLEVDMDLESVETLSKIHYQLDYVAEGHIKTFKVESQFSQDRLEEMIRQYKDELIDSYDVHNMDLASDSEESIVCLD
nr:uncharacterized protein LOC116775729 isoform X2 [Danaus plexippus plexippus]